MCNYPWHLYNGRLYINDKWFAQFASDLITLSVWFLVFFGSRQRETFVYFFAYAFDCTFEALFAWDPLKEAL